MAMTRGIDRSLGLAVLSFIAITIVAVPRISAQPMPIAAFDIDEGAVEGNTAKPGGFSVKKEDEKINEQLQDFARYRDKKAWDRAFKALVGASDAAAVGGMSPTSDGFFVPTKDKLFRSLLSLPPAGREAYRLFNDAKAKQLWESILAKNGTESLADLRTLVDRYFINGVGPRAADRLGDAYLESGEFGAAAKIFGQLVDSASTGLGDESLPLLRLHFKRCLATARARQPEAFAAGTRQIKDRFPGEKLTIGGREIDPVAYLDSVAAELKEAATPQVQTGTPVASSPIRLPSSDTPAWQMQFLDADMLDKMFAQLQNNGWAMQATGFAKIVPPAASDDKRLYANWCGIVFAVDSHTGKLIWRTGKFTEVADKFQEVVQNQIDPNRYALTLAGDSIYCVSLRLDKLGNQDPFRLFCYATDTGKKKWATDTGPLEKFGFVGKPLVIGRTIYIAASPKESPDIALLALSAEDGKLQWQLPLGTPQVGANYRGMPVYPLPTMLHHAGTLYLLTNNGALLAVDLSSHTISWAFTNEIPPPQNQNMGWNPYSQIFGTIAPRGVLAMKDSILYFKETGLSVLYALDPAGPTLLWRRPVETSDMLAGIDSKHVYLLGLNFSAVDLVSRSMLWSPAVPVQSDTVEPVLAGSVYYMFTGRGIYSVDTATQNVSVFHGFDRDSFGGNLIRAGDQLISVSNLSITAYSLQKSAD